MSVGFVSGDPLNNLTNLYQRPIFISANRPPTTNDLQPPGTFWEDGSASPKLIYQTTGTGVWSLTNSTSSDLNTLTGDSGGAISPSSDNIDLLGTTNQIVTTGAGNAITWSLADATQFVTSIETPLIIAGNAGSMSIKMGDNAGVDTIAFIDSDSSTVASIDSNGGIIGVNLATSGTTQTLGSSNSATTVAIGSGTGGNTIGLGTGANASAQTVNISSGASGANSTVNILSGNGSAGTQTCNILTGTRAGALNLGTGAAAHVISIGSASAGAVTVDTASGISLDAATASNFTVTGAAQDLTLASAGGSIAISSTENAANAIALTANGGTSETIVLTSSQGTGAASIALTSTAGGLTLTGGLATADAINIVASNAAGGIDIDCGTAGINAAAANGPIVITSGTGAINISADAAATTVNFATGGSVKTLTLGSSNGASVSTLQSGSGGIAITATNGAITANSGTGAIGISTDATATTVSIASGAGVKVLNLGSTNSTSSTNLTAGSGGVNCATDFALTSVATKILMNGGAATDFIGTATLTNGTVTIANTNIAAGDRIMLSRTAANASTALGMLTYSISAGASFTVTALETATPADTEVNDQSSFSYIIFRQT